jgi:hypothetical protein
LLNRDAGFPRRATGARLGAPQSRSRVNQSSS